MSKNLRLPLFCLLLSLIGQVNAQNVGIGTATPNSSAKLHIESTNSGLLIPRVALVAVNNGTSPVNTPVTGVLVYNTNAAITGGDGTGFYFWNGTQWVPLKGGDNTLDMAYDEGGPGAGRIITADAGRVEINGTGGLLVNANTTTLSEAAVINNTNGTSSSSTQIGYVGVNSGNVTSFGIRTIARAASATALYDGPMGIFASVEAPTPGGTINLNTTTGSLNKATGIFGSIATTTSITGSIQDMIAGVVGYTGLHNSGGGTVTGSKLYGGLFGGNGRVLGLLGENSAYMEFLPRWQVQNYETAMIGFYNTDPNGGNNGANIGSGESYFSIESNITNSIQKNLVLQTRSVGNVGIGTNTPSEKLHVVGNTRISSLSGLGNRLVQSNATGVLSNIADGTAGQILTTNGAGVLSWTNTSATAWNLLGNAATNPSTNFVGTTDNQALVFRTFNTENMRINTNGNIGVGTTSNVARMYLNIPATDNTVYGAYISQGGNFGIKYGIYNDMQTTSTFTKYALYNNFSDVSGTKSGVYNNIDGTNTGIIYGIQNQITNSSGSTRYGLYNWLSGGTGPIYGAYTFISPDATSTNNSIYGYYASITSNGTGQRYGIYSSVTGATNAYAAVFNAGNVVANEIGGDYDFRIESDNRANLFLLDASADLVRMGNSTTGDYQNGSIINGTVADYVVDFDNGLSEGTAIGIGSIEYLLDESALTTINNNFAPSTNGTRTLGTGALRWLTVYATNGTINTSDEREKKNINNLNYGLKEIMSLRPVSYQWKSDYVGVTPIPSDLKETKLGFVAQEVKNILPEIVKEKEWLPISEDKPEEYHLVEMPRLGMSYTEMIPVLVKAIQEQQSQIKKQEETIESQKNQIKKQEESIDSQKKELQYLNSRLEKLEKMMEK